MANLSCSLSRLVGVALGVVVYITPASASLAFSGTVYSFNSSLLGAPITPSGIQAAFAAGSVACTISTDTINYSGTPADFGCSGLTSNFGIDFVSELIAPSTGSYNFSTTSDDGSVVLIDGVEVVNNAFFQGATTRSGSATLTAGDHFVELLYFQGGGGDAFTFTPDPNVSFSAVPEPSTIVLGAAGLLLLAGKRFFSR